LKSLSSRFNVSSYCMLQVGGASKNPPKKKI
jgi:hypothetical protein